MERRQFLRAVLGGTGLILTSRLIGHAGEYKTQPEGGLNRLKDPAHPTLLEKKHVPAIVAPKEVTAGEWFEVKVKVGYLVIHPSIPKHWITQIYLLKDGEKIAETNYPVGGVAASEATFKIRLEKSATLEAVEHCNLHGTWIGAPVHIKVKKV